MGATLAVFLAAFAYFWLFRGYGFQVEDEGTLFFQLVRVLDGERPYLDFHTGYGPAFFTTASALFASVGRSVIGFRLVLAVINAASAAGLYMFTRRLAGPRMAGFAPALWIAFIPVFAGEHAAFNIPYPAWFATLAWVAVALLTASWTTRGGWSALAIAGVAAAVAFAVKLNAGAFSLAAVVWVVCLFAREDNAFDRFAARSAAASMALGVWLSFGFPLGGIEVITLLLPAVVIALVAAGPARARFAKRAHPRAAHALAILAGAFLVPTAIWTLPLIETLGAPAFAREVLLLGSGAAELYYSGPPAPQPYGVAAGLVLLGVALAGRSERVRAIPAPAIFGVVAVFSAIAITMALPRMLMPEGLQRALLTQAENATFWLIPLVNVVGGLLLWLLPRSRTDGVFARSLAVTVPLACGMYLQLFPRTDFMHVVMAAPMSLVLATGLLGRAFEWWSEARWPGIDDPRAKMEWTAWVVVIAIVALEVTRSASGLAALVREADPPDSPALGLALEPDAADDLVAFGKTGEFLASRTAPGAKVLAFPALSGVLFAADRKSPVPHDYWFPGRPSHDDERDMLARLAADPPPYAVSLNRDWTFFSGAPAYFAATRDHVRERYTLAARFGRYDVLQRNDLRDPDSEHALQIWQPTGPREEAVAEEVAIRRQGAARWTAGIVPEDVTPGSLPPAPREAVLLLRAVGQSGDIRTAGLVLGGLRSGHARVRREALRAAGDLARGFDAARNLWAGDFALERVRRFVEDYADVAEALAADPETAEFARALLLAAGIEGGAGGGPETAD